LNAVQELLLLLRPAEMLHDHVRLERRHGRDRLVAIGAVYSLLRGLSCGRAGGNGIGCRCRCRRKLLLLLLLLLRLRLRLWGRHKSHRPHSAKEAWLEEDMLALDVPVLRMVRFQKKKKKQLFMVPWESGINKHVWLLLLLGEKTRWVVHECCTCSVHLPIRETMNNKTSTGTDEEGEY